MSAETAELLKYHWAMDSLAAETLADQLRPEEEDTIAAHVDGLPPEALAARDSYRYEIGRIFTGQSDKTMLTGGSCSSDSRLDQAVVMQALEAVHETYNGQVIGAVRINGAKPRSGGKELEMGGDWTGQWHSIDPKERQHLFALHREAFLAGKPILTEVTGSNQLGALAPFLSAIWLGARDMPSTGLRTMATAYHLPTGLKNGTDGKVDTLQRALINMSRSSEDNSGSGVDLGTIASMPGRRGVPVDILPIGAGNVLTAIIARGHELPPGLPSTERRAVAVKHLSDLCMLGEFNNRSVVIDGSHDVPEMFDIPRKNDQRFPQVMEKILPALESGEISNAHRVRGLMVELGSANGKTDANWIMNESSIGHLVDIVGRLIALAK